MVVTQVIAHFYRLVKFHMLILSEAIILITKINR